MSVKVSMKVNGKPASAEVEARTLLVTFIRENLRLTGTHVGCDTGQCGACTVHMNGRASQELHRCSPCRPRAPTIMTIEGWRRPDGTLHPMQAGVQGVPRPAVRLLHAGHGDERDRSSRNAIRIRPSSEVREGLEGNLCRCTGYHNIVKSVMAGRAGNGSRKRRHEEP